MEELVDIDFARTIGRSYTRYQYVDLNMSCSLPAFIFFGKIQGSFPHIALYFSQDTKIGKISNKGHR